MKVGDLIESHRGERGLILGIELLYPNRKGSPPRTALIHYFGRAPHWHKKGIYSHVSGIKKVLSRAKNV